MPLKRDSTEDMQILNVRVTPEIIDWIDSLVKAEVYQSRSEAVRDFIRDYLRENR